MRREFAIALLAFAAVLVGICGFANAEDGGGISVGNGDVNGDGTIDISDAVYLLSSLFLGGKAPVAIECLQAGGGASIGNGDVNGDRVIDISDPGYLLSRLFLGGPAPVEIECSPALGGNRLPATGQSKCYDNLGAEIACASPAFPGQDGFYEAGCPAARRFVDNGDGTLTDTCTGLMWQQDTADVSGSGTIDEFDDRVNWQGALKYCESLEFAGFSDWRLPNVRELQSIVDYGRFDPAADPVLGPISRWYWTSTSSTSALDYAWHIGFYDGSVFTWYGDHSDKSAGIFVRAVRGERKLPATGQMKCYDAGGEEIDCATIDYPGQDGYYRAGCASEGRFADNGDGTVTDLCTGLMWQRDSADVNGDGASDAHDYFQDWQNAWQSALQYCEDLSFAGDDGWRLPNVRELQSIIDYGCHGCLGPRIQPVFGVLSGAYWSSTSFDAVNRWCVWFNDGGVQAQADKVNKPPYVRAVRRAP
jgi:hypothetical protein